MSVLIDLVYTIFRSLTKRGIHSKTPTKTTKVEKMVNTEIIFLFVILVAIAIICALGSLGRQLNQPFEKAILLLDVSTAWAKFPQNILTFVILFNNLIPLR